MEVKAYLAVLRRRAWILVVVTLICISVVTFGFDRVPPVYEASTSLRILTPIEGGATYTQYQIYYGNRLANTYVELASSNGVLEEMQRRLGIDTVPVVNVEAITDSEIIRITVEDSDPELAMNAANTLAAIVSTQSMGPYTGETETAPEILQNRLDTLLQEYDQARKEADDLIPPYARISAEISILNRSIVQKEANYQDLRRNYEDAQVSEAVEIFPATKAQAVAKQNLLSEKLETLGKELEADKAKLEALTVEQMGYMEQLNTAKRIADLKESSYNSMMNQVDLARIAENIRVNSSGTLIIDHAELPTAPTGPSRWMAIGLGALIGLVGGLVLAFIVESLDSTIYSVEEVEAITGLPSLGTVPAVKMGPAEKLDLLGSFGDNPPLRESFRTIAASLLLQTRGNSCNPVMVTSAEPMEGKSTFISYLAIALAQSRRSVIVVDGDMRLSRQHLIFHLPNEKGLSDVLADTASLEDVIQESEIANVHVMTSGTEYANPVELLVGPILHELMEQLSKRYDYVLIDSPSYLAVADSELLAEVSKGVILVTRRKESSKDAIRTTHRMLADTKTRLLGVVVNSVKPKTRYAYYHRSRSGKLLRPGPIVHREKQQPLVEEKIAS